LDIGAPGNKRGAVLHQGKKTIKEQESLEAILVGDKKGRFINREDQGRKSIPEKVSQNLSKMRCHLVFR